LLHGLQQLVAAISEISGESWEEPHNNQNRTTSGTNLLPSIDHACCELPCVQR
jgi:hypothetical protein